MRKILAKIAYGIICAIAMGIGGIIAFSLLLVGERIGYRAHTKIMGDPIPENSHWFDIF